MYIGTTSTIAMGIATVASAVEKMASKLGSKIDRIVSRVVGLPLDCSSRPLNPTLMHGRRSKNEMGGHRIELGRASKDELHKRVFGALSEQYQFQTRSQKLTQQIQDRKTTLAVLQKDANKFKEDFSGAIERSQEELKELEGQRKELNEEHETFIKNKTPREGS